MGTCPSDSPVPSHPVVEEGEPLLGPHGAEILSALPLPPANRTQVRTPLWEHVVPPHNPTPPRECPRVLLPPPSLEHPAPQPSAACVSEHSRAPRCGVLPSPRRDVEPLELQGARCRVGAEGGGGAIRDHGALSRAFVRPRTPAGPRPSPARPRTPRSPHWAEPARRSRIVPVRAAAVGPPGARTGAASSRRRSRALKGGARQEEEEEEPDAHGRGAGQEEEPGGAGRGGVRPSHGGRGPAEGQRLGSHGPHQRPHQARDVDRWPRQARGRGRLQEAGHQELPRWVRSGEERTGDGRQVARSDRASWGLPSRPCPRAPARPASRTARLRRSSLPGPRAPPAPPRPRSPSWPRSRTSWLALPGPASVPRPGLSPRGR